jgi:periplasmic divalent cation tolerance protein
VSARFHVVLTTAPNSKTAELLARGLVKAGHAACVNVIGGVQSHYRWHGKLRKDREFLLLAKTTSASLKSVLQFIKNNHPYDVPEALALPISAGSSSYLKWLSSAAGR